MIGHSPHCPRAASFANQNPLTLENIRVILDILVGLLFQLNPNVRVKRDVQIYCNGLLWGLDPHGRLTGCHRKHKDGERANAKPRFARFPNPTQQDIYSSSQDCATEG